MLQNEPDVAFFQHEAQNCLNVCRNLDRATKLRQAFAAILSTPSCDMECTPKFRGNACHADQFAWLRPRKGAGPPKCVEDKVVGFDVAPTALWGAVKETNTPGLTWSRDWPALFRLPGVTPVVYARTNQIKLAMAQRHGRVFFKECGELKTVAAHQRACYQKRKEKINEPMAIDGRDLAHQAQRYGEGWKKVLERVANAAGRKPFVLYYEALQADAKKELTRLFAHVGLRSPRTVAKSSSMKITSDDLRPSIASFVKVRREVAAISPGLAAQLADTSRAVFKTIYLAGNRTASFARLEAE